MNASIRHHLLPRRPVHARLWPGGMAILALGLLLTAPASAQMMQRGMMDHGMMDGGAMNGTMMNGDAASQSSSHGAANVGVGAGQGGPAQVGPAWVRLRRYVQSHQLACLACHQLAAGRAAPPFLTIANRYAGRTDAQARLSRSISHGVSGAWSGYPRMVGGMATQDEAKQLARLILDLHQ